MAASGAGAPNDRPPGDEPLGGKAKKVAPKDVIVLIPELSQEELMKHGVLPVVNPLKKKKMRKTGLCVYMEEHMCPEMRKRRVSRPSRGKVVPGNLVPGRSAPSGSVSKEVPLAPPCRVKSQLYVTESDDSEADSDASDVEHYLYRPLKDHHEGLHSSSESDGEGKPVCGGT